MASRILLLMRLRFTLQPAFFVTEMPARVFPVLVGEPVDGERFHNFPGAAFDHPSIIAASSSGIPWGFQALNLFLPFASSSSKQPFRTLCSSSCGTRGSSSVFWYSADTFFSFFYLQKNMKIISVAIWGVKETPANRIFVRSHWPYSRACVSSPTHAEPRASGPGLRRPHPRTVTHELPPCGCCTSFGKT